LHHRSAVCQVPYQRCYATYADRAVADIQQSQGLIEEIERAVRGTD